MKIDNCPVCGSAAELRMFKHFDWIECSDERNCGLKGSNMRTEELAIAAWNELALRYTAHDKLVKALKVIASGLISAALCAVDARDALRDAGVKR